MTRRPRPAPLRRVLGGLVVVLVAAGCSLGGPDDADDVDGSGPSDEPRPLRSSDTDRTALADVRTGGTVRIAVPTLPSSLNAVDAEAAGPELDTLLEPTTGGAVRLDDDGGWDVDPLYARSVRIVDRSPLTVDVRLLPRARWQGGEPITSADMTAYWRVARDPEASGVPADEGWGDVAAVETRGELAYRVRFDEPRADWPLFVYPRLPRSATRDAGTIRAAAGERAVPANGPFAVAGLDEATGTVTLRRNPDWWGPRPRLDRVVWRIADADLAARALEAGTVDGYLPMAGRVEAPDDAVVRRAAGPALTRLTLNAGTGALRDVSVRRAVQTALDRRALADRQARDVGIELTVPGSILRVPGQRGATSAAGGGAPDPDTARRLLRAAGYSTDTSASARGGRRVALRLVVPQGDSLAAQRATQIRSDLGDVGIAVEVVEAAADTFADEVLVPLDFDLVLQTRSVPPLSVASMQDQLTPRDAPMNITGTASTDPDDWRAAGSLDTGEQSAALDRLDQAIADAAVAIPLLDEPRLLVVRPEVANLGVHTWARVDWLRVGLRR